MSNADKLNDSSLNIDEALTKMDSKLTGVFVDAARAAESVFLNSIINNRTGIQAKIPEDVFIHHFLPFFSGEAVDRNECMSRWLSVAGTPLSSVDVFDHKGDVLFTVPPIYDTSVINVANNTGSSLLDIASSYNLKKNNIPAIAEKYAVDEMSKKTVSLIQESEQLSNNQKTWNNIFKRYGKGGFTNEVSDAANDVQNPADDVVYD